MRPASILLALVVVLGFGEIATGAYRQPIHDYTFVIHEQMFGIRDYVDGNECICVFRLGPLGVVHPPFTTTQGLVGFCLIVIGLIALVTAFTFRWKRKAATRLE